jgi:hypothetical protein
MMTPTTERMPLYVSGLALLLVLALPGAWIIDLCFGIRWRMDTHLRSVRYSPGDYCFPRAWGRWAWCWPCKQC